MDMKSEQEMWPDILMLRGLITTQNVDWPGLAIVLWLKKICRWTDVRPGGNERTITPTSLPQTLLQALCLLMPLERFFALTFKDKVK